MKIDVAWFHRWYLGLETLGEMIVMEGGNCVKEIILYPAISFGRLDFLKSRSLLALLEIDSSNNGTYFR